MSVVKGAALLVLGAADLVALNAVLLPAAIEELDEGVDAREPVTVAVAPEAPEAPPAATPPVVSASDDVAPVDEPPAAPTLAAPTPAAPTPAAPAPAEPPAVVEESAPAPAPDVVAPEVVDLRGELFFETGRATLLPRGKARLRRLARADREGLRYVVVGHADKSGPESLNLRLGRARARAVAKALRRYGVDGERIVTDSRGEANARARAHWRDRRVDVEIAAEGSQ